VVVLAGAAAILVLAGAVPMDRIKKAAEPADAAKDLDAVKDVDAAKDAAPAKEADAKKDDHEEDYGYDGERLYADQEEDFEAYGANEAKNKSADAADEYERYLEEVTKDMMENPKMATDIIEELEDMEGQEGLPDEELQLLKIARRIRDDEDARTRLEEQERETVNKQRRQAMRQHERDNGVVKSAGDFDFGDADSELWLADEIDEQKLVDVAKQRVHQLENLDRSRRVAFLQHEMKRLLAFKKAVTAVSDPAKKAEMIQKHEEETEVLTKLRGHAPGHKAMLEEIWADADGMDVENFNPKTMFRLHDLNGDDVLDIKELEALFFNEAQKLHSQNKKGENKDKFVVREEMARMREFVTKEADKDQDGMISLKEWLKFTGSKDFADDKEWEPVNPDKEISEKQLDNFKKLADKIDKTKHHELDPKLMKVAKEIADDFKHRGKHGQARGAAVEPHDAVKHRAPEHPADADKAGAAKEAAKEAEAPASANNEPAAKEAAAAKEGEPAATAEDAKPQAAEHVDPASAAAAAPEAPKDAAAAPEASKDAAAAPADPAPEPPVAVSA